MIDRCPRAWRSMGWLRLVGLTMALASAASPSTSQPGSRAQGQEAAPPPVSAPDARTDALIGTETDPESEPPTLPPGRVDVRPEAQDGEIARRLQTIMSATNWFKAPEVEVKQGVVFLSGGTDTDQRKRWAGDLARNTQDVVAVVNRIEVAEPPIWDFAPARAGLHDLWRSIVRSLPFAVFGLLVLAAFGFGAMAATRFLRRAMRGPIPTNLLREVAARAGGGLVFLAGVYVILHIAGLTRLALTVLGGTGLIGLVIGIAFRDITENFLASVFLSIHHPFRTGDLIEVSGITGYVQQVTVRTTVLTTLDGNGVQVPNATVYKSTIRNFTSNPNRREVFSIGIGYDTAIDTAQDIAQKVLRDHPAVLNDPEPWVLADALGSATVTLKIYFWLNGREHSWLKVRSSVIRLVKRAFQEAGISMPDEAREVLFPQGVTVRLAQPDGEVRDRDGNGDGARDGAILKKQDDADSCEESPAVSTSAEGGLTSEAEDIKEQARGSWLPDGGKNLLEAASARVEPRIGESR